MEEKNNKPYMVLLMNRKIKIFFKVYCYLIFTNTEILLAYIDKEKEEELFYKFMKERKSVNYSFGEMDFIRFLREFGEKYYKVSMEDALNEDDRNTCIPAIEVIQMWFKASKRLDSFINNEEGMYTLQIGSKKIKFTHNYRDWNRNIYHVLFALYKNKVKYYEGEKPLSHVFKAGRKGFY